MILLMDNFDPHMREFYKYINEEYSDITVIRNDELPPAEVLSLCPQAIIIGSGCGTVNDTGACRDVLKMMLGKVPVLGIGLGAEVLGECIDITYEDSPVHKGRAYNVGLDTSCRIFNGMPNIITCSAGAARAVNSSGCPADVNITARDEYSRCLAFECRDKNAFGIFTYPVFFGENGRKIICNFISLILE